LATEDKSDVEDYEEPRPEIVKRFMYVNRRPPHGTIYALECLEVVLITAAFEQFESLVFIDDGVYQLKKDQDTTGIGTKNFSKTYRALDDYDVERIYVEKESLEARGLTADDLIIQPEILTTEELREIMAQQDVVMSS
jgi:tRNA 2-thiouridine synthesizing protein C